MGACWVWCFLCLLLCFLCFLLVEVSDCLVPWCEGVVVLAGAARENEVSAMMGRANAAFLKRREFMASS